MRSLSPIMTVGVALLAGSPAGAALLPLSGGRPADLTTSDRGAVVWAYLNPWASRRVESGGILLPAADGNGATSGLDQMPAPGQKPGPISPPLEAIQGGDGGAGCPAPGSERPSPTLAFLHVNPQLVLQRRVGRVVPGNPLFGLRMCAVEVFRPPRV